MKWYSWQIFANKFNECIFKYDKNNNYSHYASEISQKI